MIRTLKILLILSMVSNHGFAAQPLVKGFQQSAGTNGSIVAVPASQATKIDGAQTLIETGNPNLLVNPGFEHATVTTGWTVSNGTPTADTATYLNDGGKKSLAISLTAVTGDIFSQSVTPGSALDGVNITHQLHIKTSLTTLQWCSLAAGSEVLCVDVPSTNKWVTVSTSQVGPSSGSIGVKLKSISSTTGSLNVDAVYSGVANGVNLAKVNGGAFFGSIKYASAASCQWSRASSTQGGFSADTDCATPTVRGQAAIPGTKIPGATFASWPRGYYRVTASGGFMKNSAQDESCYFRFSDGTNTSSPGEVYRSTETVVAPSVSGIIYNASHLSSVTLQVQAASDSAATCAINNGAANGSFEMIVEYFPDFDQDAYSPDKLGWVVYGTTAGADISLGTAAVASPTEIVSASLTMTKGSSSLSVEVPCSSTNASTGLTCSSGSEGLGVVYTQPTEGLVEACFDFTHQIVIGSNGPDISTFFRVVETANNSQTAIQTGTYIARHRAGESDTSGQRPSFGPSTRLCNVLYLQPGKRTLRLNYTQTVTNTLTSSTILDNTFAFTVTPLTQTTPAPLIKNSVTSNSNGVERIERASMTNGCVVNSQSGTWITGTTNNGSSNCTITIASGIFSATPACTCTGYRSGGGRVICSIDTSTTPSATAMRFFLYDENGTATGNGAHIHCMGPR